MNTCPTSVNSTHTAQQPCGHIATAKHHSTSAPGSTGGFPHHQVHPEFGPTRNPSLLIPLPVIHAESWSGLNGEYAILSSTLSRYKQKQPGWSWFCLTQSPKAFPGFVESWPLSLFCPQPGQSDGGGKNLNSFLLKHKRKVLDSQGHHVSQNCALRQTQDQQQETHPGKAQSH